MNFLEPVQSSPAPSTQVTKPVFVQHNTPVFGREEKQSPVVLVPPPTPLAAAPRLPKNLQMSLLLAKKFPQTPITLDTADFMQSTCQQLEGTPDTRERKILEGLFDKDLNGKTWAECSEQLMLKGWIWAPKRLRHWVQKTTQPIEEAIDIVNQWHEQDLQCDPIEGLKLWIGGFRWAQDASALQSVGIRTMINCSDLDVNKVWLSHLPQDQPLEHCGFRHIILNVDGEYSPESLRAICKVIDLALRDGEGALIHCWEGINRSATVSVAYLMYKNNWGFEEAKDALKKTRTCISVRKEHLQAWANELGVPA